jgi:hypothetical protein
MKHQQLHITWNGLASGSEYNYQQGGGGGLRSMCICWNNKVR